MQNTVTKVETMVFRDNEPGDTVEYTGIMDPSFKDGYETDCALAEFLSRPVCIGMITWLEGAQLSASLSPWHLYFNDARVKRKLDNYGLVHCNLKIKVMINASPFYYGHGLVSYEPLPIFGGGNIDTTGLSELVQRSQRPHIWIYPQESKGGELSLPFFYHKNWLRANVEQDFLDMGTLDLRSDVNLLNANGVSGDNIEILIYAWAENVALAAPTTGLALQSADRQKRSHSLESGIITPRTHYVCHCDRCPYCVCFAQVAVKLGKFRDKFRVFSTAADYALQSTSRTKAAKVGGNSKSVSRSKGKGDVSYKSVKSAPSIKVDGAQSGAKDEYGQGPVEIVCSAVSAATGALGSVPVIGPYMTATSFVAKNAANVAAFFGWSNPPVITNVNSFKDVPFHAMACPEISTPVEKLTLDPKNELCVDSRTVGLDGTDEMSISSIVSRESHVNYIAWNQTSASGTLLHTYNVSPAYWEVSGSDYGLTPMAHLSQAFEFWRGDIIFRFQVICTPYHRGRIRVSWDPTTDILANANTESVTFTRVYDIAEDRDFEIRVPYMQALPWLRTRALGAVRYGNPGAASNDSEENGQMTVRVLNTLTAPDAASNISIAVSVRGADNLCFAGPKDISPDYKFFALQSSDIPKPQSRTATDDEDGVHALGDPSDYVDSIYLINHGEAVKSMRTVLRRYGFSRSEQFLADTTSQWRQAKYRMGRFPLNPGFDPNGIYVSDSFVSPGTPVRYNFNRTTAFNWLANCFIGMRGSMNWRFNVESQEHVDSIEVQRFNGSTRNSTIPIVAGGHRFAYIGVGTSPEISARDDLTQNLHLGPAGGTLLNQKTQTGVAIQAPMYSRFRMLSTNPAFYTLGTSLDESNLDSMELQVRTHPLLSGNANTTKINYYCAAGTDFTLFFYLNVPTVHLYATPPLFFP